MLGNKEVATRQYVSVRREATDDGDNADEVFLTILNLVGPSIDSKVKSNFQIEQ